MMNLLKIELLKLKKSSVLTIALGILAISLLTSIQLILTIDSDIQVAELLGISMNMFALFYYPIFIILFISMLIRLDNMNNIWKVVLSSGVNKIKIYLAKYIFTLIVISIFVFINILAIILASIIKLNMTEIIFIGMKTCLYVVLASAGVISIEFIIALIFKSFLIPISVGAPPGSPAAAAGPYPSDTAGRPPIPLFSFASSSSRSLRFPVPQMGPSL